MKEDKLYLVIQINRDNEQVDFWTYDSIVKANAYARYYNKFINNEKDNLFLVMTPKQAVEYLDELIECGNHDIEYKKRYMSFRKWLMKLF